MKVPVATGLRKDDLVGKLVGLKKQRTLFGSSVALAPAVAACTGPCVRLAPLVVRVCRLALLLYYPTHAWAEFDPADAKLVARGGPHVDASECAQLRAQRLGLEFYPVHVRLSKPLFATRTELRLTLAAKTLHAALASLLARPAADPSGSASPLPISFAHAVDLAECNGQPLLGVLPAAMSKHALPLLAQLKVFVAELDVAAPCASSVDHRPVLVEALAAGVGLLEKQHMYGEAVEVLCVLRDKAVFDARLRVGVWDRLSLDYLHATWIDNHRERAAEACRQALADDTADQFHAGFVAIARRLDKLTGGGGGAAAAATAPAVRGGMCGVEGRRVQARHAGARPPSKKAKFVNPDEDGGNEDELEVSVERLAMLKYGEEGWAGVHDEGRAIHALATALCPFAAAFAERLVAQLTCHVCVCVRACGVCGQAGKCFSPTPSTRFSLRSSAFRWTSRPARLRRSASRSSPHASARLHRCRAPTWSSNSSAERLTGRDLTVFLGKSRTRRAWPTAPAARRGRRQCCWRSLSAASALQSCATFGLGGMRSTAGAHRICSLSALPHTQARRSRAKASRPCLKAAPLWPASSRRVLSRSNRTTTVSRTSRRHGSTVRSRDGSRFCVWLTALCVE